MRDSARFFASFVRNPLQVGSIFPSSRALARAMVDPCDLEHAGVVVELGPGTGPFTREIAERLRPGGVFLALELDAGHVQSLRERFPGVQIRQDSAEHLGRYLAELGSGRADCVVSGLPWANFGRDLQQRILGSIAAHLERDGVFTTFSYWHARALPTARRFRALLREQFEEVTLKPVVWRNLPPAFVYCCRRPRR